VGGEKEREGKRRERGVEMRNKNARAKATIA
jgi:hypothetical protein